jgi:D-apiose dehydrogenase
MSNKLRGVCLGAGYFSGFQYEAWSRIPEVEIVALCNRNVERGRDMAARHGVPRVYGWDELALMLDREKPDFVDIITPPESHLEIVEQAAPRGIAIICQKPLAPTWEESVALVERVQQHGVRFMVHENFRWQPWYREIKRLLAGGELGDLFSIGIRTRMGDGWPKDAYLARQPYFRTYPRLFVYETGVHFLDTFRFLGGEISSVYARLQKRNPDIMGEDAAQLVCGFANGATAMLDASRYNESDAADARYTFGTVRVDGSKGHVELDLEGNLTLKLLGQPSRALSYFHERRGFAGDCVYHLQRHFTDCMLTAAPFESTGEDYLKSVGLVEACYRSQAAGQVVDPAVKRTMPAALFNGLDHFAIAVPSTEEALKVWRDKFGFAVLYSEDVNNATVRLTHLDLGNTHLQLVEPLTIDHPLQTWLKEHGSGLHHVCLRVADVGEAMRLLPQYQIPTAALAHQGTRGKQALFLNQVATPGVQVEVTGA